MSFTSWFQLTACTLGEPSPPPSGHATVFLIGFAIPGITTLRGFLACCISYKEGTYIDVANLDLEILEVKHRTGRSSLNSHFSICHKQKAVATSVAINDSLLSYHNYPLKFCLFKKPVWILTSKFDVKSHNFGKVQMVIVNANCRTDAIHSIGSHAYG